MVAVRLRVADPPAATLAGTVAVRPDAGLTVRVSVAEPVKPFSPVSPIVLEPLPPVLRLTDDGVAFTEKSGVAWFVTVTVTVAVWTRLPLVAVTVTV